MRAVNLRLPDELHAALVAEVTRRKRLDPGASLNSLILEALVVYTQQPRTPVNTPGE